MYSYKTSIFRDSAKFPDLKDRDLTKEVCIVHFLIILTQRGLEVRDSVRTVQDFSFFF